jgi:hypothetical protein
LLALLVGVEDHEDGVGRELRGDRDEVLQSPTSARVVRAFQAPHAAGVDRTLRGGPRAQRTHHGEPLAHEERHGDRVPIPLHDHGESSRGHR